MKELIHGINFPGMKNFVLFERKVFCIAFLFFFLTPLHLPCEALPRIFLVKDLASHNGLEALINELGVKPVVHDLKDGLIPADILFQHVNAITIIAVASNTKISDEDQNLLLDYFTSRGNGLFLGKNFIRDHDHTEFLNEFLLAEPAGEFSLSSLTSLKSRVDANWPGLILPAGNFSMIKSRDSQGAVLFDVPDLIGQEPGFALRGKT